MSKTKVALLGTGFIAKIHLESYARFVPDAEVVAVYGRTLAHAQALAAEHGIPQAFDDLEALFAGCDAEVVDICLPNYLHYEACMAAARHNKHVIVEKPLALTLEQADEMIAACRQRGLLLMYAEELCFAPKYERVRALVERGAVGKVYLLKQAEKHSGPHSRWFYQKETAGGGVMMDMGCHALAWFRWMTGNAAVKSVYADMKTVRHQAITDCDDNAITIVEFANGARRWPRTAGPSRAAWTTASRSTATRASPTPTCSAATPPSPTASAATTTPAKRPARPRGGASPSLRRPSTRATRRSWRISSTACAPARSRG